MPKTNHNTQDDHSESKWLDVRSAKPKMTPARKLRLEKEAAAIQRLAELWRQTSNTRNVTITDMAKTLGISQSTAQRQTKGEATRLGDEQVRIYASALGVKPSAIMPDIEDYSSRLQTWFDNSLLERCHDFLEQKERDVEKQYGRRGFSKASLELYLDQTNNPKSTLDASFFRINVSSDGLA